MLVGSYLRTYNYVSTVYAEAQENGDVKLVGNETKERLEVFLDGEWGSVCFDSSQDQLGVAQTVCRQLGKLNQLGVYKLP